MIANIRPGILVALKTHVTGGVEHLREEVAPEATAPEGGSAQTRKTTTIVEDVEELDRARAARSAALAAIGRVCVRTDFGLLCLASREGELDAAVAAAQALALEHNRGAQHTSVEVYVLKGRVAESDAEATKGIAAEVRGLIDGMSAGIAAADPKAIREAASRARKLGALLDESTSLKVSDAVAEAREAARVIVKRVVDGGEEAATVVAELKTEAQDLARFAFLDLDPVAEIAEPIESARDLDIIKATSEATGIPEELLAQVGRDAEAPRRKSAKKAATEQGRLVPLLDLDEKETA